MLTKFFKKSKIEENHVTNRTFDYSKDGVSLRFTLRTDVKDQLETFKELLEKALGDVSEEIEREQ